MKPRAPRREGSSPVPALGFVGLAMLIVSANACIFDEGKYKKGGRLDTAASVTESSSSSGKASSSSGNPLGDDDDTTAVQDSGSLQLDTGAQ
jgi:hypothetical protein